MNSIAKILASIPLLKWLLPLWLIEIVARVSATLLSPLFRASRFGMERKIRGTLLAAHFGSTGLQIDRNLQIEGHRGLQLGDHVTLYGGSHFVGHRARPITIGSHTHVARNSVLSGLGGITIGDHCAISSGVLIYSITQNVEANPLGLIVENEPIKEAVVIGNDVWIGAGATILPGVTIGDHAIVGAGSVVTKNVEPWQLVVGTPARVVKDRRKWNEGAEADNSNSAIFDLQAPNLNRGGLGKS